MLQFDRGIPCSDLTLPTEAEGDWDVIRVLIVSHEDPVIAGFGKELSVPLGAEGNARSNIDTGLGDLIGLQYLRGRNVYR